MVSMPPLLHTMPQPLYSPVPGHAAVPAHSPDRAGGARVEKGLAQLFAAPHNTGITRAEPAKVMELPWHS